MSSSGYHPSPHLHRVGLHSHGKRPFEECGGYDSDPDDAMPIQPSSSGTSASSSHRFPAAPSPETRNKRARSTSSTSTDASSNPSSSGYSTAQSSSRSDLDADGPSALPPNAVDCPVASPPPFVSAQDVLMSDLHLAMPPTQPQRSHIPTPPEPEDSLRTSLQRFAEFDRQIAALRTSLAATRSQPLPPFGPSLDGDPAPPNDHWHPNPSNFLSNGTSAPPPSVTADLASPNPLVPNEALHSLSTFASSNDNPRVAVATSTASGSVPSASLPPTYSNVPRFPPYPSYRPSAGTSSPVPHERVGEALSPTSTPAFMRPSSNENATRMAPRSSIAVETSASTSASHVRHVRERLSPLMLSSDPSSFSQPSVVSDDFLHRYRTPNGDRDPVSGRSQPRSIDNPVPNQGREILSSRPEDRLGVQSGFLSQDWLGDRARVIREHSIERESVPSVFDVFSIGASSSDRNRPLSSSWEPVGVRHASTTAPSRPPVHPNERSRGPTPITTMVDTPQVPSQDSHTRFNSSWTSIPSSNSLMSESASERRHALALERFRARTHRFSFEADDESDNRWLANSPSERDSGHDLVVASPVSSLSVESMPEGGLSSHLPSFGANATHVPQSTTNRAEPGALTSFQNSFSDLISEAQRSTRDLGWDTRGQLRNRDREGQSDTLERQRDRAWDWERDWERPRDRSSLDVRGRSLISGLTRATTSSTRDESLHPPGSNLVGPSRPSLGQLGAGPNTMTSHVGVATAAANNNQQYSYSNLNLSSFQSGLFRDSLRRNAEVDQASFSSSGPVMSSVSTGESRTASRLGFEDSGSEMDLDDFMQTRPPSPEWSRPHPYAGRTPPPDYSPPSRNSGLRSNFSILRRGSMVGYDASGRPQHPNRNTFSVPVRPAPSGPTRPTSYESNNQRPAPPERTERDRFTPARILESFYRSHEDGRRNASTGTGQPYNPPYQNHALPSGSNAASRNERPDAVGSPRSANGNGIRPGTEGAGENRRSSLGLGGSIRSRLARFAQSQSSSNTTEPSSSRQRSPSHPIGARPQVAEQHRRGSLFFGNTNGLEQESRSDVRSVSGPLHWPVNGGAAEPSVTTRDAPWRASPGPRSGFGPPPPPAGGPVRPDIAEEHRSRLRTLRQRLQLSDRGNEGARGFRPALLRAGFGRRANLGDYVPDELFDDSYEALLSLSSMLGEVRSRATPEDVITSLPTGTFKDWKKEDSETRCPICLDDYEPLDVVTKLIECPHWLHKHCLEQWLRTANTCPVCREKVQTSPKPAPARRRPFRDSASPSDAGSSGGRPLHANTQSNGVRPVSFAMVFDRAPNDGRDTAEPSSTFQAPSGTRSALLERVRNQQQQQRAREPPYVQGPPYPFHAASSSQSGPLPRPTADGPGVRPMGFASLRGQGSDTSMNASASSIMDADAMPRRATSGMGSGSGPGSGMSFLDMPTTQRRESMFSFVPPPSGSGPAPQPHQHDTHAPAMVIPNSRETGREWRGTRMYDVFNLESSRSSSAASSSSSSVSGPPPRPITSRLPINEESPESEEYFMYLRLGLAYPGRDNGSSAP